MFDAEFCEEGFIVPGSLKGAHRPSSRCARPGVTLQSYRKAVPVSGDPVPGGVP
ncbi:hypothetical protein GCM10027405_04200 [Arthrobacter alkaliphilus]